MSLTTDEIRELSIDTSLVAVRNISFSNHGGLVTLKMRNGVVQQVWCGTQDGLLVWSNGRQLVHLIPNVQLPLIHG